MAYLKYIQYFYLFAFAFFIYLGIDSFQSQERNPWLMFFFAAMALFMFFFRRKFINKMNNTKK
ncbi:hypothetical protein [Flavobacterium sp.]|uniref:hypothetical protein n=1 Tax=Flavobacterium sp. TaxID=239 RepID=UPI002FD8DE9D